MNCDFVTLAVSFLDGRIVSVLVRDKISGFDIATVWVFALAVKYLFVQFNVVIVNRIIEGDSDHLRDISGG